MGLAASCSSGSEQAAERDESADQSEATDELASNTSDLAPEPSDATNETLDVELVVIPGRVSPDVGAISEFIRTGQQEFATRVFSSESGPGFESLNVTTRELERLRNLPIDPSQEESAVLIQSSQTSTAVGLVTSQAVFSGSQEVGTGPGFDVNDAHFTGDSLLVLGVPDFFTTLRRADFDGDSIGEWSEVLEVDRFGDIAFSSSGAILIQHFVGSIQEDGHTLSLSIDEGRTWEAFPPPPDCSPRTVTSHESSWVVLCNEAENAGSTFIASSENLTDWERADPQIPIAKLAVGAPVGVAYGPNARVRLRAVESTPIGLVVVYVIDGLETDAGFLPEEFQLTVLNPDGWQIQRSPLLLAEEDGSEIPTSVEQFTVYEDGVALLTTEGGGNGDDMTVGAWWFIEGLDA